uniref:Uncharacterized protein n=1 Tax=Panagrellus redivivus TaxID=6233 RepID=A0A7E4V4U5_PANRE
MSIGVADFEATTSNESPTTMYIKISVSDFVVCYVSVEEKRIMKPVEMGPSEKRIGDGWHSLWVYMC